MITLKKDLDFLVQHYENTDFIANDPIQFPHRFQIKQDIEISALISSSLSFGKREKIIQAVECIHQIMNNKPYCFCKNYTLSESSVFDHFKYRYVTGKDMADLIYGMSNIYQRYDCLEDAFLASYDPSHDTIKQGLVGMVQALQVDNYLIPSPDKNSACKRLNMFLRWVVRSKPVDLGVWTKVCPSKLIIPLDVHVARISRQRNLLNRKINDWASAQEITLNLRKLDPKDPCKYDFALFGAGVNFPTSQP